MNKTLQEGLELAKGIEAALAGVEKIEVYPK